MARRLQIMIQAQHPLNRLQDYPVRQVAARHAQPDERRDARVTVSFVCGHDNHAAELSRRRPWHGPQQVKLDGVQPGVQRRPRIAEPSRTRRAAVGLNIAPDQMDTPTAHQAVTAAGGPGMQDPGRQAGIQRGRPELFLAAGVARLPEHVHLFGLGVVLAGQVVCLHKGGVRPFLEAPKEIRRIGIEDGVDRIVHDAVTFNKDCRIELRLGEI